MVYDKLGSEALPQPAKDATIDQLATALRNAGSSMSDTQVVSQTAVVEGWVGESANQYVSDVNEIKTAVETAQTSIESSAQALTTYQTEFNNLKTKITNYQIKWDEDLKWYKEEVKKQESDRKNAREEAESMGEKFDSSSWDNEISKLKTEIERRQKETTKAYNNDVEAVDSTAYTVSNSINDALEVYIPGISSGASWRYRYAPDRTDLGVRIFGDGTGLLAAQTKWEDAMADAPKAAKLLNQTDPDTGLPREAALKEFNEEYGGRLASDPYFASAFLKQVGAEKLYSIAGKSTDQSIPASHISALKSFTESVGAGIILATGGNSTHDAGTISNFNSVDKALSIDGETSVESWRSKFQGDLISNGQKRYDHDGEVITENRTQMSYLGYELLGQYIGHGAKAHPELSLGDDFLNGVDGKNAVGKAMVKWDAEHPRNFDLINASAGPGPSGTAKVTYGKNGIFRDGLSWDYLQNMYEAMDNNPDDTPAQKFMNSTLKWDDDHNGDTPDKEMNMTRYLVGNRSQDGKVGDATIYWADDKGEALGRLINEISGDTSNKNSVNIAYNFLEGYNDGLYRDYDHDNWRFGNQDEVDGQDIFGNKNSALRSHIDDILSEYSGDLAHELDDYSGVKDGPSSSWDPRDGRYHMVLNKDLYERLDADDSKFFKDLGADKEALTNFGSEAINQMSNEYYNSLVATGDTGHLSELRNDIVSDYEGLLQNMDAGESNADKAAGINKDKQVSTVTGILKFANNHIVGNIPGAGPYIKDGVGYALDLNPSKEEAHALAEHLSDGSKRDARIQESLNDIRQHIPQGKVDNPIEVHRAPTSPNDSNYLPLMREYNAKLPENEQFLDKDGNIPLGSNGLPDFDDPAKEQAFRRYTLDLWSGQGLSKDTDNH